MRPQLGPTDGRVGLAGRVGGEGRVDLTYQGYLSDLTYKTYEAH